jgi:hypothetical protein
VVVIRVVLIITRRIYVEDLWLCGGFKLSKLNFSGGEVVKKGFAGIFLILAFVVTATCSFAAEDVKKHGSCLYCGMEEKKFGHSWMVIEYEDGTSAGLCSIHCAAIEFAQNMDKTPKVIKVGDYNTKQLIDAGKAFWVIGGSKQGVMTKRPKWAFEKKEDAEKFIKENGGTLATFDEAMKAAYEDMYADTKMIRDKRKMMKQKMMENK